MRLNDRRWKKYGLATRCDEGEHTHEKRVCYIDMEYKGSIYSIGYDFGYGYSEESRVYS